MDCGLPETSEPESKYQIVRQFSLNKDRSENMFGSQNVICEPVPVLAAEASTPMFQDKMKKAFSYVEQVRRKLIGQPLIYNEFIAIMRKVHSRSIETPDVVASVSKLFKDHPDLIQGFNAFLPLNYRMEVQVKLRVSVSGNPSPEHPSGDPDEREEKPITSRIISFTLNVRKRFEEEEKQPEKYKRFVEVLYLYKSLSDQLQGVRRCGKRLKEEDVYAEVTKLFENNDDLLKEFGEYLPYNKKLTEDDEGEEDIHCECSLLESRTSSSHNITGGDIGRDSCGETNDTCCVSGAVDGVVIKEEPFVDNGPPNRDTGESDLNGRALPSTINVGEERGNIGDKADFDHNNTSDNFDNCDIPDNSDRKDCDSSGHGVHSSKLESPFRALRPLASKTFSPRVTRQMLLKRSRSGTSDRCDESDTPKRQVVTFAQSPTLIGSKKRSPGCDTSVNFSPPQTPPLSNTPSSSLPRRFPSHSMKRLRRLSFLEK